MRYDRTTKARQTGTLVRTAHGLDLGLDYEGEGPWYNVCETHNAIVSHTALSIARYFAATPAEWCEECREAITAGAK